ncbi:uncharacterized protein LOC119677052 [Teleopsis dalmanni]|uniref:uncharacterized protein LOC119677052 n=1 Tax=Teleopsis dalmanni TaxID=139649 RepID=UPI0018CEAE56|nr:uncharacterized protein LOC119677052 [Teleopsis dalmanni]
MTSEYMGLARSILFYVAIVDVITFNGVCVEAAVKLTNIKCVEFDRPFASFNDCRLKIIQRGIVALNLHVVLHQVPVNNVSVNVNLFKKASGYRPFLYNITADFCEFMANRKRFPVLNIVLNSFTKSSNINHTCPYNHDIIVKNFVVKDSHLKYAPLPTGDYLIKIIVGAYNDWKADVKVYLQVIEINN